METSATVRSSNKALWAGRIISALCIIFLLFDAVMKIIREAHSIKGSTDLGWPEQSVQALGITLLVCTVLYMIPRTAVLGAVLVAAYLGGAVAIMVRVGAPFYFPVAFGILVWLGLFLRLEGLRKIFPMLKR